MRLAVRTTVYCKLSDIIVLMKIHISVVAIYLRQVTSYTYTLLFSAIHSTGGRRGSVLPPGHQQPRPCHGTGKTGVCVHLVC